MGLNIPQYENICTLIKNGFQMKNLIKKENIVDYRLIDYIMKNKSDDIELLKSIKEYYNNAYVINNNRCLVISDNHMGRLHQNEDYNTYLRRLNDEYGLYNEKGLYMAFNYAISNNINNIIHAGDLLEGNSDPNTKRLPVNAQEEYLKMKYPQINGINTFLLLGNHDYNTSYFCEINEQVIRNINYLDVIGVNYSYISFCNRLIKVSHYSKLSDFYENIDLPYEFELSGHSHSEYMVEERRKIGVPALAVAGELDSRIGFYELIDEEHEYLFKLFDKDCKYTKEYVLKKLSLK